MLQIDGNIKNGNDMEGQGRIFTRLLNRSWPFSYASYSRLVCYLPRNGSLKISSTSHDWASLEIGISEFYDDIVLHFF